MTTSKNYMCKIMSLGWIYKSTTKDKIFDNKNNLIEGKGLYCHSLTI